MRHIKFRGQTIGGEWVTGNLSILEKDFSSTVKKGYYISNSAGAPFAFMVRPESVGQLTPFKDLKGKEVYIGDITQDIIVSLKSEVVFTDYGNIGLKPLNNEVKDLEYQTIDPSWFCTSAEIIGNIHTQLPT